MSETGARSEATSAVRVPALRLREFVAAVFVKTGLPAGDAARCAELMVAADARGADGHGVFRLPQYVKRIASGGINLRPDIRLIEDHPASAVLDGDNGMGHLVMTKAAHVAIEKARASGAGWVGVRYSNHAGPASLYASMPLAEDMIGVYIAIGNANHMAPWGGVELLLSTNPIAVAVPTLTHPPVVLDMATSVAAYGKVKRKVQDGEMLPEGWMIDAHGAPLTDPGRVSEGSLLPIGGPKGYGLAFVIGLLAGTLNGAAFGRDVVDFNSDSVSVTNTGHAILALDVKRFMPVDEFKRRVDLVIDQVVTSTPREGGPPIRVPGAHAAEIEAESRRSGVALAPAVLDQLRRLADEWGVEPL